MDDKTREIMFSNKSDEYETPDLLFEKLHTLMNFSLDPAASDLSHVLDNYYTIEDDGLSKSWDNERWFINPPYSKAKAWLGRAADEFISGNSDGVLLVPARTETVYWHDNIWPIAHYVLFLRGRLKFVNKTLPSYGNGGKPSSAPYPSAVIFYTHHYFTILEIAQLSYLGVLIDLWKNVTT